MRHQLQDSRQRRAVDIESLKPDELNAYIAGLDERRQSLISQRCDGSRCSRCSHAQYCDHRSQAA